MPASAAARRLGLTLAEFEKVSERLYGRGFPRPDPDTHRFDLDAIDQWRRLRNASLFGLAAPSAARDANDVVRERVEKMRRPRAGSNGPD
ncbi:hypothetical protein [Methylobacterium sp. J-090]|uniref:hypothetical protein n=1 Tax=Methylobacterium sp. J-090 TaxID=2836666 RepID=UPI001FBB6919|nr:hypothetical protein [Methylobacterium sp. J-090]MCJ2084335.1 hypothetical protein [Methylobacterium sp. J-090]